MKKLIICGLSVIVLAACGGDDEATVTPQPQPQPQLQSSRMLTVEVSEKPMQDDASSREANLHRASVTTTASLSHFILNYTEEYSQGYTKTGDTWSSGTWPPDYDNQLDFYANDGGTFVWNIGNPYVSFTMDENAFNQKDLLVAKTTAAYGDHEGKVYLTFDHACAAVQFNVYKEETATTYVVKSIKLQNVKNSGNYYYSSNSWDTTGSSTAEYTLTNADIAVTTGSQLLPCGWLFVIPQEKSGLSLEVKYTKNGGSETTKNLSLSAGNWQAGKQYTVNIRIGKAAS